MPAVYGAIDLQKNELRNAVIQNLAGAPAGPIKGQMYFNSTGGDNTLYWYDGTGWIPAKASTSLPLSSSASTLTIGGTANGGSASDASRGDHVHAMPGFGAVTAQTAFGAVQGNGSAVTLARSDHTHGTPTHNAAAHAGISISALSSPTAAINMNNFGITNLPWPVEDNDAVPKLWVESLVSGLSWKDACYAATTANITLSGLQTIDGVALQNMDRVLVKNQTNAVQNGFYYAQSTGWERTEDAQTTAQMSQATVFITAGTTQADTGWTCTTDVPIPDTSVINFAQFTGGSSILAGTGITKTGNTFSIDDAIVATDAQVTSAISAHAGAADPHTGYQLESEKGAVNGYASLDGTTKVPIAQVPTGTSGTQVALGNHGHVLTGAEITGILPYAKGGTGNSGTPAQGSVIYGGVSSYGASSVGTAGQLLTSGGGGSPNWVDASSLVTAPPANMAKKYAAALTGTTSPEVVTHNLNTRDIHLQVLNGSTPYTAVEVDWDATSVNTATIRFSPALGAGYRVVVIG